MRDIRRLNVPCFIIIKTNQVLGVKIAKNCKKTVVLIASFFFLTKLHLLNSLFIFYHENQLFQNYLTFLGFRCFFFKFIFVAFIKGRKSAIPNFFLPSNYIFYHEYVSINVCSAGLLKIPLIVTPLIS